MSQDDGRSKASPKFLCGVVEGFYGRPWTYEQRKDLFAKMRRWELTTYLYAPKDDRKHRAQWREPYTVEEAEELQGLVAAAKENNVDFYYAISPGLDIIYSSAKEVTTLKRKLEQISSFGVTAFAILFDDIKSEIGRADKEVFQTFAQAQVSITNEVYQALGQPKFMFCPTEYCGDFASPNVKYSVYLSTIGQKLLQGIDIMWTGSKVISKDITLKSIEEVHDILRRPPLIWDNLHANDYDQKRVFLGPYCGRSTRLIPYLRGVLTNPNCEYEANFVPIHTLAQWSRCLTDACKTVDDSSSCESVDSCGLSTDSLSNGEAGNSGETNYWGGLSTSPSLSADFPEEEVPSRLPAHSYHPRQALKVAIQEWLSEINETAKNPFGHPISTDTLVPSNASATSSSASVTAAGPTATSEQVAPPLSSEQTTTSAPSTANATEGTTGSKPLAATTNLLEPMDCNPTPPQSASPLQDDAPVAEATPEMQTEETAFGGGAGSGDASVSADAEVSSGSPSSSPSENRAAPLDAAEVSLLVDLFYMPFEHGPQAVEFLQEFSWLTSNAQYVADKRNKTELAEWYRRASKFDSMTKRVNLLSEKLMHIPNQSLRRELLPYVWNIKGVISVVNAYIKWIGYSNGYGKTAVLSSQPESWKASVAVATELQRLLLRDSVKDLFQYETPETPVGKTYNIRPYQASDERAVYEVCSRTCVDGEDGTMEFEGYPDLIGDKTIGGFLALSSEFSFVIEDEARIVGYALGALNASKFSKRLDVAWTAELKEKYPLPTVQTGDVKENGVKNGQGGAQNTRADEIINGLHSPLSLTSVSYSSYPSLLVMALLPHLDDASLAKRLLTCVIAALKVNGSDGAHVKLNAADRKMAHFYARLGFHEIGREDNDDTLVLGRKF